MSPRCVARILLAYDGSDFHGWQAQPGLRTVQGELMAALARLIPLEGAPPGAGRTDAGVHARGQVVSVPLEDEGHLERLRRALPALVPPDMAVLSVERAPEGFHARFSATGRRYAYRMMTRRDPLRRRDHLLVTPRLDFAAMQASCPALVGTHPCESLCRAASVEPGRTTCRIWICRLRPQPGGWIFEIAADRFLHSMVRTVVGTMLEIGRGLRPAEAFYRILSARDRRAAGGTAPAHGLCLEEVLYDGPSIPRPPAEGARAPYSTQGDDRCS